MEKKRLQEEEKDLQSMVEKVNRESSMDSQKGKPRPKKKAKRPLMWNPSPIEAPRVDRKSPLLHSIKVNRSPALQSPSVHSLDKSTHNLPNIRRTIEQQLQGQNITISSVQFNFGNRTEESSVDRDQESNNPTIEGDLQLCSSSPQFPLRDRIETTSESLVMPEFDDDGEYYSPLQPCVGNRGAFQAIRQTKDGV